MVSYKYGLLVQPPRLDPEEPKAAEDGPPSDVEDSSADEVVSGFGLLEAISEVCIGEELAIMLLESNVEEGMLMLVWLLGEEDTNAGEVEDPWLIKVLPVEPRKDGLGVGLLNAKVEEATVLETKATEVEDKNADEEAVWIWMVEDPTERAGAEELDGRLLRAVVEKTAVLLVWPSKFEDTDSDE